MTGVLSFLAIVVSLSAIGQLALDDPKRRRVFHLPPRDPGRRPVAGWGLVIAPGVLLAIFANPAVFVIWCAIVTAVGWAVVALPPSFWQRLANTIASRRPGPVLDRLRRLKALRDRVALAAGRLGKGTVLPASAPGLRTAAGDGERIARLEARLASLEAELAGLRAEGMGDQAPAALPEAPPQTPARIRGPVAVAGE